MKHGQNNTVSESQIAYLHGRIEHELEGFASSLGVDLKEVSTRVGAALVSSAGGQSVRGPDSLPIVRRKTTKAHKAVAKVGLRGRMSRKPQGTVHHKKSGIRQYWDRLTPKQRREEMQRRVAKRNKTLAAAA